ncbi:MAG: CDP-diacylglycerol--glycerol-3-phosphate 3-phosphatidyltransferase [Oscillospiraceae bacterium]|nr:CDP-diacylglycerol--glycerol-3-phosphate 3-phosphatidyltransferase [Oscillospiraceae bacterium]
MTLASKITIVRVAMIPVYMILMLMGQQFAAFAVFVLASITDFVDGYIARKYNQVSDFGKFMDPLADKLLVISCMAIFCEWGRFPSWALMLVLTREFSVTGLRLVAVESGRVIAAGWSGKIKTVSTMVALCVMMVFSVEILDFIAIAVIVLTTVVSGVEYFVKNWDVFGFSVKGNS